MFSNWLPAEKPALNLSMINVDYTDEERQYWNIQRENLKRLFAKIVKPQIQYSDVKHCSIFALAPQPLLVELGRLLSDINKLRSIPIAP